jgi:hypothetical protein
MRGLESPPPPLACGSNKKAVDPDFVQLQGTTGAEFSGQTLFSIIIIAARCNRGNFLILLLWRFVVKDFGPRISRISRIKTNTTFRSDGKFVDLKLTGLLEKNPFTCTSFTPGTFLAEKSQ